MAASACVLELDSPAGVAAGTGSAGGRGVDSPAGVAAGGGSAGGGGVASPVAAISAGVLAKAAGSPNTLAGSSATSSLSSDSGDVSLAFAMRSRINNCCAYWKVAGVGFPRMWEYAELLSASGKR